MLASAMVGESRIYLHLDSGVSITLDPALDIDLDEVLDLGVEEDPSLPYKERLPGKIKRMREHFYKRPHQPRDKGIEKNKRRLPSVF
jgi:hypothetical protein